MPIGFDQPANALVAAAAAPWYRGRRYTGGVGSLEEKTAFVSAGTSVVGAACARAFAAQGARICVADGDPHAAVRMAAELQAPAALGVALDMQDEASWAAALERCVGELQGLNVVVLCSEVFHGGEAIVETSLSGFRDALYGSGLAPWLGQKQAVLALRGGGEGGAIIHVTSLLGRIAAQDAAGACAGSAGVLMSARAAALECAKAGDGIVVNTVLSGPVFLMSDGAQHVTGAAIVVDGGRMAGEFQHHGVPSQR